MDKIIIGDTAYDELLRFLNYKNLVDHNIRINIVGSRCSGPTFKLTASEIQADDIVEKVKNINFIIRQALLDELGGFTILSTEENHGKEFSIRPFNTPKRDCRLCGRGCP